MRRLILAELLLSLWSVIVCNGQSGGQSVPPLPPVGQIMNIASLSPDNPNHKTIFDWLDTYRRSSAELDAQLAAQASGQGSGQASGQAYGQDPSRQDLVAPNYASINDALRIAANQPPAGGQANPGLPSYFENVLKQTPRSDQSVQLLDPQSLGQLFTPTAFANPTAPRPTANDHIVVADMDTAKRLFEQNRRRIEKLDPAVQDHIRKLQEQSADGHHVLVEVKGDNTRDDTSLLDKLRPLLYDPSALDELKPQLRESKVLAGRDSTVHFQHKTPTLDYNKPLLEQREKIEEVRTTILERPRQYYPQPTPAEEQQLRFAQFNGQLLNPGHQQPQPQQQPQPVQVFSPPPAAPAAQDKNQLIRQLEALALQPLLTQGQSQQYQPKPSAPQHVNEVRQPLVFGAPDQSQQQNYQAGNQQAQLLGQRQRQQPQFNEQPLTIVQNWGHAAQIQPDNSENHQVAKRQEGEDWNSQDRNWDIYAEQDPQKQKILQQELVRHLEEQDRKRQELMELDQKQRELIAEEVRKQEERDRLEVERKKIIAEIQAKRKLNNQGNQGQQPTRQERPWQERPKQEEQAWAKPQESQAWPKQEQPAWSRQQEPKQEQPAWSRPQEPKWQPITPPPPQPPIAAPFTAPTPRNPANQQWFPQEEPTRAKNQNNGPFDFQPIPAQQQQQKPQSQQRPAPIANWPSNGALTQFDQNQKQSAAGERGNGPIQISAAALAQAEQSDAEYVKLLREILLNQGKDGQLKPETRFVETQPIGPPLPLEWWRDNDRSFRVNNRPKEGSHR